MTTRTPHLPRRRRPFGPTLGIAVLGLATVSTFGQRTTAPTTGPATTQAAAASQPADADVAALIRKLGADEDADRADAQQQLVDLGATAVDALQAAEHDADPEIRSRSKAALAQIRDRDANGPTLVTLHVHGADVASVLAKISEQAHAEVVQRFTNPALRGAATVTLDADRKPFWEVLSDVCGQANLCPTTFESSNHNRLELIPTTRNWIARGPHQVLGPFCVALAGLDRQSGVDLSGPAVPYDQFSARLVVFPEPKLVVTQISQLTVREAVDDAGNSLVQPTAVGVMRVLARLGDRGAVRTVLARLKYPTDHPGHRIVTLAGDLTVTLAQGTKRFEADDVMVRSTVTRPLPGVKVRVAVAKQGPLGYMVTVECVRDGLADPQWYAMTNRVNDMSLEDAAGHPLTQPYGWMNDAGNSDTTFKATGTFIRTTPGANLLVNRLGAQAGAVPAPPPPGEPTRIVWNVADRFKVVTVPVAFHDLPMP